MHPRINKPVRLLVILVILAAAFLWDLSVPNGLMDWVWYLIPFYLSIRAGGRCFSYVLAGVICFLMLAAFYLAPPGIDPLLALTGRLIGISVFGLTAVFIANYKDSEDKRRRADRALRTISLCNQVLVRATREPALLADICHLIIEQGNYRMAWVGLMQNDEQKSVRCAASAGCDEGYLAKAHITWSDKDEHGRGPTGTAIRTGQIIVCHNIATDPRMAPWREEAVKRGYASSIALPLCNAGKAFGLMMIYAAEPNAFNSSEVDRLAELADDLAFGLHALRTQAEHKQTEEALRASENRMQFLLAHSPAIIYSVRARDDFATTFVSPNVQEVLGYPPEAFLRDPQFWFSHLYPDDATPVEIALATLPATDKITREYRFHHGDGTDHWIHDEMRLVRDARGQPLEFVGYWLDITEREQAEEAQRRSEQNYREIYNATNEAIFLQDAATGRILDVNAATLRMYGYDSKAQIMAGQIADLSVNEPPFTQAEAMWQNRLAIEEGPQTFEWRARRQNGEPFWAEVSLRSSQVGGQARILAVIRDITERKLATAALDAERQLLANVIENSSLIIYFKDREGRCQLVNRKFEETFGLKRATVLGHSFSEFLSSPDGEAVRQNELAVMAAGKSETFEEKLTYAGKSWIFVAVKFPLRDAVGNITGVCGMILDITERKQIEEAHARLATVIEQASEAIMITDLDGTIQYANPAFEKITGYRPQEVLGKNPRLLKSGRQDARFYRQMWDTLKRGETWKGHFTNRRKDGSFYEENSIITPIRNTAGDIINYVASKQDVTHELQLEAQFRQAQKMEAVGTLAGGIAHDFNNILTVIIGYCYLLQNGSREEPGEHEKIGEILKAANRAKDLVQQILTFSRKYDQQRQVIRMNPVITEATQFLRATLPANIQIELHLAADAPTVLADPTQIYQVTVNLATNALQAMEGRQGRLTVSLAAFTPDEQFLQTHPQCRPISYARLTVADTGRGMDAKTLEHIFEPFFTTKTAGRGTGLGLAVVHGIIQSHDGLITVTSQPGQGTAFDLYFPAQTQNETLTIPGISDVPLGHGQKILVVDDETAVTTLLQQLLELLKYHATTSNRPREAIDWVRKNPSEYDLVITNLTMPEMDGLAMARQLRAIRTHLPVILTTGSTDIPSPEKLTEAGICQLLKKPVSMEDLAGALQKNLPQ